MAEVSDGSSVDLNIERDRQSLKQEQNHPTQDGQDKVKIYERHLIIFSSKVQKILQGWCKMSTKFLVFLFLSFRSCLRKLFSVLRQSKENTKTMKNNNAV